MSFEKIDPEKKLQEKLQNDPEFAKAYFEAEDEYELIKKLIKRRKELEVSQKELAEITGVQQQVISRLERGTHSPTLKSFLKIVAALGLEIKLVIKETTAAQANIIQEKYQYLAEAACSKENLSSKDMGELHRL